MENPATLKKCPCCHSGLSSPFYFVGPVPVHSCLMMTTVEQASAFPTSDVELAACPDCGFVTNIRFDSKWSAYAPQYEDQQSFSPTFNSFAGRLAKGLVERHGLAGKTVVEVGCSKGDFLSLLCEAGGMNAIGIDPSAVEGRVRAPSRGSMRLIAEYYGPRHLELPADLLCNRHTLEHIQDVHEFLVLSKQHAERNPGAVLCIEVPDYTRVWRDLSFEDIYYEHCSYFTPGSLARAARRAGFSVTDLRREFDDQYLILEASLNPADDRTFEIEERPGDVIKAVEGFQRRVDALKDAWRRRLAYAQSKGQKVAVWGSGSKCVSFLKTLGSEPMISAIVDINPHRAGKIAPGLSIPIATPSRLKTLKPDLIIAMNSIYRDEIAADCADMGLKAKIMSLGEIDSEVTA